MSKYTLEEKVIAWLIALIIPGGWLVGALMIYHNWNQLKSEKGSKT